QDRIFARAVRGTARSALLDLTNRLFKYYSMIFQTAPAPTPWQTPNGPAPEVLFERYFQDLVNKTWGNISPLYQLDSFDWTILILYFAILGTLAVYGGYRIK